MDYKQLLWLGIFILLLGCQHEKSSTVIQSTQQLFKSYPTIQEYTQKEKLDFSKELRIRHEVVHDGQTPHTLYGITERNQKGIYFNDSSTFQGLKIEKYILLEKGNEYPTYTFFVYSFDVAEEHQKFENFHSSLSRDLEHNKEAHEFFSDKKHWYMHFIGFP